MTTHLAMMDTMDTQRVLEDCSYDEGVERYREAQEQKAKREGYETRDDVAKLIRGAIPIVAEGIKEWLADHADARGRKPTGYAEITALPAELVAYSGLSSTFAGVSLGSDARHISHAIGVALESETEALRLITKDKKVAKSVKRRLKEETRKTVAKKKHNAAMKAEGVALEWSNLHATGVGGAVLNCILTSLPGVFVKVLLQNSEADREVTISLTTDCAEVLTEFHEAFACMRPIHCPMVAEPKPWTALDTGCYHDARLARTVPLVRTYSSEHKKLLKAAIDDGSMAPVLKAVNAMQSTRWTIDKRIAEVILWAHENGLQPSRSFPLSRIPQQRARVSEDAYREMPRGQRGALRRQEITVANAVKTAGTSGIMFNTDMGMAEFLAGEEAFYIPHSMDSRGRVYAVPHFNHQRSEHIKALFRFADDFPLGDEGGDWLMIHLANCGDFEKVSKQPFDVRIQWVRNNAEKIIATAYDPAEHYDFWSEADSPFCFLQACFEYAEWAESNYSPEYRSGIAIAADGSCSGLQHYSAITRSEEEAHHVNLVPRSTVGDIYQIVADAVVPILDRRVEGGCIVSSKVLAAGVGRSLFKRNTMTYFYGSGRFGMREQHLVDTMQPLSDDVALGRLTVHPYDMMQEYTDTKTGEVTIAPDSGFQCANVLADLAMSAILTVAPKADEAASWVQDVAGALAKEELSLIWTTPMGLPVVQRYDVHDTDTLNMWLYDRAVRVPKATDKLDAKGNVLTRVRMTLRRHEAKRINKKRMRSASSPNLIHSMDAAHLQRAVAYGRDAGIEHFAMIHDSFGTHAGNMTMFSKLIRTAFVDTYKDYCPLEALATYARSVLSEDAAEALPSVPQKGNLDLNLIMDAQFAFA